MAQSNFSTPDMVSFLTNHTVPVNSIKKLIDGGINTLQLLTSINFDHKDWDEIAKKLGLNVIQKLKIKASVSQLMSTSTVTVNKVETKAMKQMKKKIKDMEKALFKINMTVKKIDLDILAHSTKIKYEYNGFHSLLKQRETLLLNNLNEIGISKKDKLSDASKSLHKLCVKSKKKTDECAKRLQHKTIDPNKLCRRKMDILQTAKEIDNIKIINSNDPIVTNTSIMVNLNNEEIIDSIRKFGKFIDDSDIPVLISLKKNTNNNNIIYVQWKLNTTNTNNNDKKTNNNHCKLRIEYVEIDLNNDKSDDFDEKKAKKKEFNLLNNNNYNIPNILTVSVTHNNKKRVHKRNKNKNKNKNKKKSRRNLKFRLKYSSNNGIKWSLSSNMKIISIKPKLIFDTFSIFDPFNISLINNSKSITMIGDNTESIFLKQIVNCGIHNWKFRVDKYKSGNQLIGIWNNKYKLINMNSYLWNDNVYRINKDQLYGFGFHSDNIDYNWIYFGKERKHYGFYIKNRDIIEMIVDLNQLQLSFKINDTDYGKACDIVPSEYRAAITICSHETQFTLLSYTVT